MSIQLDHIGIAVKSPSLLLKLFEVLGLEVPKLDQFEFVKDQKVNAHFIEWPAKTGHFELLQATDPDSSIGQFITKKGPGIHHISLRVGHGELDPLCIKISQNGFKLIYSEPKMGAHQMRVQFIHPASTGGVLVEVMEPSAG